MLSGSPTASPEASTTAKFASVLNPSITGVFAWRMAFPYSSARSPQPSMTISAARFVSGMAFQQRCLVAGEEVVEESI